MKKINVKLKLNDFYKFSSDIICEDLFLKSNYVYFYTNYKTIRFLKYNKIEYEILNLKKIKEKYIYIVKTILSILILFFTFVYYNSLSVSNIIFSVDTKINNEIENIIYSKTKKILWMDIFTYDLDKLSKELRIKYISYPYISITRKANKLFVDIKSYDTYTNIKEDQIGSVVSKYDSIISYVNVYNGIKMVSENDYVKKGDILISSNKNKMAKGLILGNVYETYEINVLKTEVTYEYSNNKLSYYNIKLFNKEFDIKNKNNFTYYDFEYENKFNILSFFSVKRVNIYEKYDIIKKYNKEEAINKAITSYNELFEKNKNNNLEKICTIKTLNVLENDDSYNVKLFIKAQKDIGEFKEEILDEVKN